ncbi:5614_t:CDS:2 [Entrophospora sp. SA101]|nr:5614_t:CDS:2 [Entrophospora sp. SA101]
MSGVKQSDEQRKKQGISGAKPFDPPTNQKFILSWICLLGCGEHHSLLISQFEDTEDGFMLKKVSYQDGSLNYDDFVSSLGWEIDLATHPGYLGGLERNSTNGTTSIYYCTSTIELIFHDVTKMPTDPNDFKQLKKKRHIGNDHVHIIFNEHNRDYRKSTIGGDFGNAQIVVNPLSNGLFSVEINRDHKIPSFGPLLNGMVISQNVLGPLVRMTAIQAFRNSLHHTNSTNTTMYQHPFTERALDISIIMNKHKNTKCNSYETFMSKIFVTDDS